MMGSQPKRPTPSTGHVDVFRLDKRNQSNQERGQHEFAYEYPPRIPVAMRHPYPRVNSVKQYTTDRQHEQLKQHIVSESFIPVSPEAAEKPQRRSRRRPPFSYSSLIAQAILTTANKRMTLRDIYRWITEKYPALYNAEDTGWQNTIRHNLSLNKCFKKVPKSEITPEENRGKGGFWTLDPEYMNQYTDGAFARGSIANRRSMKNPSKSGPSSDSEVSHFDGSSSQYDTHHTDVDPFTSSPPFRLTSPSTFKPDDTSHYYPTEESDISSNTPSPSMLRMSPVTPPRSSVTIKVSTTDRGTAVNTVHNTTTPIDEQTVVNLDVQQTRLNREEPQENFLSTILHPSKEEDPFSTSAQEDPLHTSTVMRIDNILN